MHWESASWWTHDTLLAISFAMWFFTQYSWWHCISFFYFRIPMSLIGFEFVFLCLVNKLRVSALCRDQKSSRALNVALWNNVYNRITWK
jgi:hypothetical protein